MDTTHPSTKFSDWLRKFSIHSILRNNSVFSNGEKDESERVRIREQLFVAFCELAPLLRGCVGCKQECKCMQTKQGLAHLSDIFCLLSCFARPLSNASSEETSHTGLYPPDLQAKRLPSAHAAVVNSNQHPWWTTDEKMCELAETCIALLCDFPTQSERDSSVMRTLLTFAFTCIDEERKEPDYTHNRGAVFALAWWILTRTREDWSQYETVSAAFMMVLKLVDEAQMHHKRTGLLLLREVVRNITPTQLQWADVPILKVLIGCLPFREDQTVVQALVPCCVDVFAMLWDAEFAAPSHVTTTNTTFKVFSSNQAYSNSAAIANRTARGELLLELCSKLIEEWNFLAVGKERAELQACMSYTNQLGLRLLPALGNALVPRLPDALPCLLAFVCHGPDYLDMKDDNEEDRHSLQEQMQAFPSIQHPPPLSRLSRLPSTTNLLFPLSWSALLALCGVMQTVTKSMFYHRHPVLESLSNTFLHSIPLPLSSSSARSLEACEFHSYTQMCVVSLVVEAAALLCSVSGNVELMNQDLNKLAHLSVELKVFVNAVHARIATL